MSHTKGKWTIVNDTMIFGRSVGGCQMQKEDFMIAQIRGWGHLQYLGEDKGFEIQKANARRICQTNNNFDALLDACKKVQRWLDTSSLQGVLVHRTDAKEKDALIMGVASHLIRLEQAIADAEKGQGNE